MQEIGFTGRNQFLDLFLWDFAMQNCFAHTKATRLGNDNGIFAGEGTSQHMNLSLLANRTKSNRFVLFLVHFLLGIETVSAEIEHWFLVVAQLN